AAVADEDVALGAPVDVDVSNVFSDPDGDGLTLQATGLPQGVTLNGTSISGTPTTPGTFNVTVTASDGEFTASDTFTLTVLPDTSTEPEVNVAIAKQMITDDEAFSFTVPGNAFDDADGDPLSISIAAPAGFSVNGSTVSAPAGLAPGTYTFTVTATDPDQNAVSQSFSLTVNEAPPEPEGPVTLWLVDPDTDQLIRPLSSTDVIGRDELTSGEYNIAAIYDGPGQPKSARMFLDGQQLTVQGGLPYALFNDQNGDYNGEPIGPLGSTVVISAQVFASGGGNGALLGEVSVTVTFVAEGPTESASDAPMLQSLPPAAAPQGFELSEDELQADAGPAQVALEVPVFEMPVELTAGLVMSPVMDVEASSFALTPAMPGLAQLDTFDFSGVPSEPIQSQLEAFMTVPMTDAMSAQAPLVQSGMIDMAVDQFGFDEPFNWSEDDAAWNTPG
ncbi:MAG: putative Ig domain-containing protein, partial [Pseudomonadota bacterium]